MTSLGRILVVVGGTLVVVGLLLIVLERLGAGPLSWLGRLPGDIRIEGERTRVYIPLTTSILISLLLTGLFWLFRR